MNIEKHIVRLLYAHDCVIVPGFGGFICRYAPAALDPETHVASPPSKRIAFNPELKRNDGLLASFIASAEKVDYADAFTGLQGFAGRWTRQLSSRRKVVIDGLGILYADREGLIHFDADRRGNFLYDSFGLAPVKLSPVEQPARRSHTRAPSRPPAQKPSLVPIAALFILMVMVPMLIPRMEGLYTSMAPLPNSADPLLESTRAEPLPMPDRSPHGYRLPEDQLPAGPSATGAGTDHYPAHAPVGEVTDNSAVEAAAEATVSPAATDLNPGHAPAATFHIIVGCFGVEENAERMIRSLRMLGFESRNAGLNRSGLTMVSASSYPTLEDAKEALGAVRRDIIANAWICRKPL